MVLYANEAVLTCAGLFRCSGRGQLDVLYTEGIESLGDGNLGLAVEESVGELLSLYNDMSH